MIIKNKLDQSFGPTGTAAGRLIFLVGLVTLFYSFYGLALLIVGALLGFTFSQAKIDLDQKKVMFTEKLFGLFSFGNWVKIQPGTRLGISEQTNGFAVLSQSNKRADLRLKDFRITLFSADDEKIMDLKKFKTREQAEEELVQFTRQLQIERMAESTSK